MKLTYQLLMQYRTPKGAWTRRQIEALGIAWPPTAGWIDRVMGKELSDEQFRQLQGKAPQEQGCLFD